MGGVLLGCGWMMLLGWDGKFLSAGRRRGGPCERGAEGKLHGGKLGGRTGGMAMRLTGGGGAVKLIFGLFYRIKFSSFSQKNGDSGAGKGGTEGSKSLRILAARNGQNPEGFATLALSFPKLAQRFGSGCPGRNSVSWAGGCVWGRGQGRRASNGKRSFSPSLTGKKA